MKLRSDEWLRLTMLEDNGKRVLDIRVWRRTATGGVPTRRNLIVERKFIVPMIVGLQKIHREESAIEASNSTEVTQG